MAALTTDPPGESSHSVAQPTVRLQPTRGFGRLLSPRDLWLYRDVAWQLAVRDVKVRYRQTGLGITWAVLQPLLMMLVFTLFLGHLAHIPSGGRPYAVFALAGLVPWTYFANSLTVGADSLVNNSALVSKIYFPRIFIPAGVVMAGLIDLGVGFLVLIVFVLAYGVALTIKVLAVPLFIGLAVAAALGVTSGLAAVNVRYRDVRYAVPFVVQLWLFATPVAYPATLVGEPWRTILSLNPMVSVIDGFRWAVLGLSPHWGSIAISGAASLSLLALGLAYFSRVERHFADIV